MTERGRVALFWIGAFTIFIVLLLVLRSILLPFVAGMAIAYALNPIADWLVARGLSRLLATVLILVVFLLLFVVAMLLLVPVLAGQLVDLVERAPTYIERLQDLLGLAINSEVAAFLGLDAESIRTSLREMLGGGGQVFSTFVQSLLSGGRFLSNLISLLVVTPFVAFYLLHDWHRVLAWVDDLLPRDRADDIRRLAREIDLKVAAFVRGQLLVGLILGIFYATGLVIIGINYGLLIGLVSGLISFIPYLGFTVGFAISIVLALVQFWPDWVLPVATIALFMVGQFIEGYVLYPRLIGPSVGIHPVWLFFALFALGLLFGFVGLLIAVPSAAAVGVIFGYVVELYRNSAIYRGGEEGGE
ncbi:MAG: AI-2E family transporter [Alphaproteobacteria bacterium]